jgi:adenosylcobinamide-GDP ribazoletransferase
VPMLLAALLVIPAIAAYWRYRVGGITGDCLGASVEVTETILLLLIVLRMA